MEQQLLQADKLASLGQLSAGVAHEINNPLGLILGYTQLMLREEPAASQKYEDLKTIEKHTRNCKTIVEALLNFARKTETKKVLVDVNCAIEQVITVIRHQFELSGIAVHTRYDPELPQVLGDTEKLKQVVMNLVMNASEAIGDKSGRISLISGAMECDRNYMDSVSTKDELPEGMYVYLEVSDTGCGMSEEVKSKLYDPFFTTKFTGRGLGMSAVLGIMRGHKGTIKVYSEVGRGTTIKVLFPAIRDTSAAAESELQKKNTWTGEGKILLADDDETIRVVVKAMLEGLGFSVETAVDGRDCLEKYRRSGAHFTAVIVDLTMPHMGGEEVFSGIRQIDKGARVILSSGYNEQEVISRFVGKGLAGFLKKPYRREELQAKLKEVLGS